MQYSLRCWLWLSAYTIFFHSIRSDNRRRRKLINAIYHHADVAVASLEIQKHNNDSIREKIKNNGSCTPCAPYSPTDDITYEQIIERMGHLPKKKCPFNRKKEKLIRREMEQDISSYFHWRARFHAIAQGFYSESIEKMGSRKKITTVDTVRRIPRKCAWVREEDERHPGEIR